MGISHKRHKRNKQGQTGGQVTRFVSFGYKPSDLSRSLFDTIGVLFGGAMKHRLVFAVAIAVAAAAPLLAHHSFAAEFDASQALRVTGSLTKIEWTNPHSYFYLDVKDESGNVVRWSCEAGSPGALSRRGFKRGDIKL